MLSTMCKPQLFLTILVQYGLLAYAATTTSQSCQATPSLVTLPIRNITLTSGQVRRGIPLQVGTPPQTLVAYGTGSFNEIYLYDEGGAGECNSDPAQECATYRGNLFNQDASSTWTSLNNIQSLNSQDNFTDIGGTNGLAGNDTIELDSSLSLKSMSLAIPRIWNQIPYHVMGLGNSSRLLDRLLDAGVIASKSWSIFWGETGFGPQSEGTLVLGGIDKSQTTGQSYTGRIQAPTDDCPSGMVLDVMDMQLVFANGTSGSIMSATANGQTTNYCLLPEQTTTTMFREQFEGWIELDPNAQWTYAGDSPDRVPSGPNGWGMQYPNDRLPQASLKVLIGGSGFSITIPNNQLIQPYWTIDSSGDIVVNTTHSELMINPLQGEDYYLMPRFGVSFIQAAYLQVNWDDYTFTLWQAGNPSGTNSQFVSVGSGSSTACPTTTSTGTGNTNTSGTSAKSTSLSGGAIGGIVVGAVVVIAAVIAGVLIFRKRRSKNQTEHAEAQEIYIPHESYMGGAKAELEARSGKKYSVRKAELEARHNPPAEVSGWNGSGSGTTQWSEQQTQRPWVPPQEMPGMRYD